MTTREQARTEGGGTANRLRQMAEANLIHTTAPSEWSEIFESAADRLDFLESREAELEELRAELDHWRTLYETEPIDVGQQNKLEQAAQAAIYEISQVRPQGKRLQDAQQILHAALTPPAERETAEPRT